MLKYFLSILIMGFSIQADSQNSWVIDRSNSSIMFTVGHLMISTVHGRFDSYESSIHPTTEGNFNGSKLEATIEVQSINTGNEQRDNHLHQSDFFEASTYPKIKFQNGLIHFKNEKDFEVSGNLTIKDVTKKITFKGSFGGFANMWGRDRAGFTAHGKINRFDFGINYSDRLDKGGLIVGEEVTFILNLEFVKQN